VLHFKLESSCEELLKVKRNHVHLSFDCLLKHVVKLKIIEHQTVCESVDKARAGHDVEVIFAKRDVLDFSYIKFHVLRFVFILLWIMNSVYEMERQY